ncbi:hypothetical protein EDD11_002970 [Mortierella claussenii]|nr:hypothetical protein EDD11_002970 [Mortierella claussenii]
MNSNNNNNNAHPVGNSGSFTETLKGYVNTAMAKGQDALHMAQEQISHATGHDHPKTSGFDASGADTGAAYGSQSSQYGQYQQQNQQQNPGSFANPQSNNDAFGNVNRQYQQQNPGSLATPQSNNDAFGNVNRQYQQQNPGSLTTPQSNNDAFGEVNQFNTRASKPSGQI